MKPAASQARIGRWPSVLADAAALGCALAVMIGVALDMPRAASASQQAATPGVAANR